MKYSEWKCWVMTMMALLAKSSVAMAAEYASYAEADETATQAADGAAPAAAPDKALPLPFHTIEGYGGGAITPMAYLVNPGDECHVIGKPSVATTYVSMGRKNLNVLTVTETVDQRIEFGYGADRFGLGTLPSDISQATTVDINQSDVWLHTFNIRGLLIKEDTYIGGFAAPAVTAGVHFKYNSCIADISSRLGCALKDIGYRRENGTDFTLTATKTITPDVLGRPLILTAGLRMSQAAELGFLGFGDTYHATFEGNVAYLPSDKVVLAYEFRGQTNPYTSGLDPLIGGENNWHAFDLGYILSNHATLVAGYGIFGQLANTQENSAWWLQLKYEY
ncbi:MAG: DUF3034 family protein [Thermoguttaceae bacterium]|jgi:hypothetical protein